MALLTKLRFLGALPTLRTLGYVAPLPVRVPQPPSEAPPVASREPEEAAAPAVDWSDPDLPLDDLRAELGRRGQEVNVRWSRTTLLKHLGEGE